LSSYTHENQTLITINTKVTSQAKNQTSVPQHLHSTSNRRNDTLPHPSGLATEN